ncbi:MAG: zf-HC2 domain-containing protein [Acidobacteriota bacterium]
MDHDTVVRAHIPERYFLGELPPAERDDFEEHMADCSACRQDLAVTDIFAANAAAVFEDAAAEAAKGKSRPWYEFLRPRAIPVLAFSGALNLALLLFVGYGVTRMSQDARPGVSEVFTIRPPARSAGDQVFTIAKSKRFAVLQFDLTRPYQRYSYAIEGAGPKMDVPASANAEALTLTVPLAGLRAGDHKLLVTGWDGRENFEIGHCVLRVEQAR